MSASPPSPPGSGSVPRCVGPSPSSTPEHSSPAYLNHDWDDAWGGELQLWSRDQRQLVERVSPQFGRMVIFETAADTFHGHPEQLRTPPGVNRRSIAFYYYSNGRPDPVPQRNTRWLADPDAPVPFKERVKESLPGPVVSAVKKVKGRLTP